MKHEKTILPYKYPTTSIPHRYYDNYEHVTWNVTTTCNKVQIQSDIFETESCCDFVTIDLTRYSGSAQVNQIVGSNFTVQFTSDSGYTGTGFLLKWACLEETDLYGHIIWKRYWRIIVGLMVIVVMFFCCILKYCLQGVETPRNSRINLLPHQRSVLTTTPMSATIPTAVSTSTSVVDSTFDSPPSYDLPPSYDSPPSYAEIMSHKHLKYPAPNL